MVTGTSLNAKLLRPGLRRVYGLTMEEWVPEWDKIFTPETSTLRYEEYQELAPTGLVPEQTSGQNVSYDDILNGSTNQVVNIAYGLGYKVTREMIDDNLYRLAGQFPRSLAKSVRLTIETLGANILNNGFNSSYTYGDGVELLSRVHPLPSGGTLANEPSSQADLSATSLEQGFIDIGAFVDARGNTAKVMPRRLIVTTTDTYTASELLGSDKAPENSNNAINPVVKEQLIPEGFSVNHYLTDPDAWFIITDEPGLIMQQRIWPEEFRDDNEFDSLNVKQAVYFRARFWGYNPRAIYGSEGA